jgi:hypothetical protein
MLFLSCLMMSAALVPTGEWGGAHVRLTIDETGARLEFDCAHGIIDRPMALDDKGAFDVKGRYVREHGGPVHKDEGEDSQPARYRGTVDGGTLHLEVVLEGGEPASSFVLRLGERARLVKCR